MKGVWRNMEPFNELEQLLREFTIRIFASRNTNSHFFLEYVDVTALGGSGLFEARNLRGSLKDNAIHREINPTDEMKMGG